MPDLAEHCGEIGCTEVELWQPGEEGDPGLTYLMGDAVSETGLHSNQQARLAGIMGCAPGGVVLQMEERHGVKRQE